MEELNNWIAIVKNPNLAMDQRVFVAKKLVLNESPEAQQAVLSLLDNSDGAGVCIPVCLALAQNGPPQIHLVDSLITLFSDSDEAVREASAKALAQYEDQSVADKLVALAQDRQASNPTRSSAIKALAQIKETQRSISLLISLLDNLNGSVDATIFSELSKVTGVDYGPDPQVWKRWWESNKELSREEQLRRQVEILRQQIKLKDEKILTLDKRLIDQLEQYYQRLSNGEKIERLKEYLVDDLESVRLRAINLVQTAIGEGNPPDQGVADIIRSRLTDPSAHVRKGVLNILGHLRNNDDAPTVVELLPTEQDEAVRLAAIETLGELSNAMAVPILIKQLELPENSLPCVEAAAQSLGQLIAQISTDQTMREEVVNALIRKYDATVDHPELRVALLYAMSSIADAGFAPMLLENLKHEQADVRLRCINGLTLVGEPEYLDTILPLLADPDAGVRREAAAAIGELSREEAHLNALLRRMNPDVEAEVSVHQAGWRSFVQVWAAQKLEIQLAWVQKLDDHSEHQMELLKNMEDRLARSNPPLPQLAEIRQMLAERFYRRSRFVEAARYWEMVEATLYQSSDAAASQASVNLLRALLRSGAYEKAMVLAQQLLTKNLEQFKPQICDEIIVYLGEEQASDHKEQVSTFLNILKAKLSSLLDETFKERLAPFEEMNSESAVEEDDQSPPAAPQSGEGTSQGEQNR